MYKSLVNLLTLAVLTFVGTAQWGQAAEHSLTIYSTRQPFLLQPMLDVFTAKTGIETKVLYAKSGLIERIVLEGENTPADLFLSSNLVQMSALVDTGITAAINDDIVNTNIAATHRDVDGHWFGLGLRTRVVYVNTRHIAENEISDYLDLARPEYKDRICIRPWTHPYNVGLVAYMVRSIGEERTRDWVKAVNGNLARDPQGNDRAQIRGVNAGECDIAIANNYYLGVMRADPAQAADTEFVRPIMATLDQQYGTMTSVSGGSVVKYSDHIDQAIRLLRFLGGTTAQKMYIDLNHEMPVRADVADARFGQIDIRSVAGNIAYRGVALALIEEATQ